MPGVLQSMGPRRIEESDTTELNWEGEGTDIRQGSESSPKSGSRVSLHMEISPETPGAGWLPEARGRGK